jgi:intracellular septation protein A
MKKTALILISAVMLNAAPYTKENRVSDMQTMAKAMGTIETGFFYNNQELINQGASTLIDTIKRVEPPIEEVTEKNPLKKMMDRKIQMTDKIVKYINKRSRVLLERSQSGDMQQATQAYTKIMQKCMECHYKIRKW